MPVLPQQLVILLPLLVTAISGWLNEDTLPDWVNAIISAIIVLLCAVVWSLLSNSLVGDLTADVVLIASYCAALMAGPLSPLHRWLVVKLTGPFALFQVKPVLAPASSLRVASPLQIGVNGFIAPAQPASTQSNAQAASNVNIVDAKKSGEA